LLSSSLSLLLMVRVCVGLSSEERRVLLLDRLIRSIDRHGRDFENHLIFFVNIILHMRFSYWYSNSSIYLHERKEDTSNICRTGFRTYNRSNIQNRVEPAPGLTSLLFSGIGSISKITISGTLCLCLAHPICSLV
jgi:hypothetical protein